MDIHVVGAMPAAVTALVFNFVNMWIILLVLATNIQCQEGRSEYCELDVFQPSCGENEVILMKSAYYGRMTVGKCIKEDFGYLGCKADVLPVLDGFCSGRRSCSVKAANEALLAAKSKVCRSDFAAYLSPDYTCLSVQEMNPNDCQSNGRIRISSDSGYISVSSDSQLVGGSNCPFRIEHSEGRKVNITMINFPPKLSIENSSPSSACYEIGSVKEREKTVTIHKCLNDGRSKQLYISNGGAVDIIYHREPLEVAGYFLLHYQAIGCGEPEVPENTDIQHNKDAVTIKCTNGNQKWELICRDGQWVGEVGNCSTDESGWSFLGLFDHEHPFGTAIVVGIGATLGVLVGGILLYIIIAIFKRCQKSDYVMTYEYTDPNFAHIPTDYHADKSNLLLQDDKLFEQNSNTWGSQRQGNSNTLSRGGTDHSRVPLPPLPNECINTLSYEKPLYNRNGNV